MLRLLFMQFLSIFLPVSILSQDLDYARQVIHDLASPEMHGRGYIANGDLKAARYISKEYKKLGLQKLTKKYFQPFTISVNTFPGELSLALNGQPLIAGKDFLVYPGSPSLKGQFETHFVKAHDLVESEQWLKTLSQSSGKFIIVDKTGPGIEILEKPDKDKIEEIIDFLKTHPDNPAAGTILFTDDKLSWRGSTKEYYKPFITVNSDINPEEIEQVSLHVENMYYESYQTQNLIGLIEGQKYPDSLIVFTAHYDHLGRMGKNTYFPGANDNASGIAMILNLASHYSQAMNQPDYTMVFLALGAEEIGIIGAGYYTEYPLLPLDQISFLINIDLAGNGEEGITVVNATEYKPRFDKLVEINTTSQYLPRVKSRGPACNSDHCPFYNQGVPSFFIYTMGGSTAYHDIYDTPDSLPLTMFENYFLLLKAFADSIQVKYF